MPSVIFSEEQFADREQLVRAALGDETDPKSWNYKRILIRPKISWGKMILLLLAMSVWIGGAIVVCVMLHAPWYVTLLCTLAAVIVLLLILAKPIIIGLIKLYQRFAPEAVRMRCRFEPSCSEYMQQSIRKYGLLQGLKKGIRRLKRCNVNGGGFDPP